MLILIPMKKLIYLWLLASVLLPAACTDDDDVFSEESGYVCRR